MGTESRGLGEITQNGREKNPGGAYLSTNLVMRVHDMFAALIAADRDDLAQALYREVHEVVGQYAVMIANPQAASLIDEAAQDQS